MTYRSPWQWPPTDVRQRCEPWTPCDINHYLSVSKVGYIDSLERVCPTRLDHISDAPPSPRWRESDRRACFSPDSKLLATTCGRVLCLWDVNSAQLVHQFHDAGLASAFSPDGQYVVSRHIWETAAGNHVCRLRACGDGPSFLGSFSADGRLFTSGTGTWAIDTSEKVEWLSRYPCVLFAPSGHIAAYSAREGIGILDLKTERTLKVLTSKWPVDAFGFSADGSLLAGTTTEDHLDLTYIWDVASGATIGTPDCGCNCGVAFHPNGRMLAVAGFCADPGMFYVAVWDMHASKNFAVIQKPLGRGESPMFCHSLSFSPDGQCLAIAMTHGPVWISKW